MDVTKATDDRGGHLEPSDAIASSVGARGRGGAPSALALARRATPSPYSCLLKRRCYHLGRPRAVIGGAACFNGTTPYDPPATTTDQDSAGHRDGIHVHDEASGGEGVEMRRLLALASPADAGGTEHTSGSGHQGLQPGSTGGLYHIRGQYMTVPTTNIDPDGGTHQGRSREPGPAPLKLHSYIGGGSAILRSNNPPLLVDYQQLIDRMRQGSNEGEGGDGGVRPSDQAALSLLCQQYSLLRQTATSLSAPSIVVDPGNLAVEGVEAIGAPGRDSPGPAEQGAAGRSTPVPVPISVPYAAVIPDSSQGARSSYFYKALGARYKNRIYSEIRRASQRQQAEGTQHGQRPTEAPAAFVASSTTERSVPSDGGSTPRTPAKPPYCSEDRPGPLLVVRGGLLVARDAASLAEHYFSHGTCDSAAPPASPPSSTARTGPTISPSRGRTGAEGRKDGPKESIERDDSPVAAMALSKSNNTSNNNNNSSHRNSSSNNNNNSNCNNDVNKDNIIISTEPDSKNDAPGKEMSEPGNDESDGATPSGTCKPMLRRFYYTATGRLIDRATEDEALKKRGRGRDLLAPLVSDGLMASRGNDETDQSLKAINRRTIVTHINESCNNESHINKNNSITNDDDDNNNNNKIILPATTTSMNTDSYMDRWFHYLSDDIDVKYRPYSTLSGCRNGRSGHRSSRGKQASGLVAGGIVDYDDDYIRPELAYGGRGAPPPVPQLLPSPERCNHFVLPTRVCSNGAASDETGLSGGAMDVTLHFRSHPHYSLCHRAIMGARASGNSTKDEGPSEHIAHAGSIGYYFNIRENLLSANEAMTLCVGGHSPANRSTSGAAASSLALTRLNDVSALDTLPEESNDYNINADGVPAELHLSGKPAPGTLHSYRYLTLLRHKAAAAGEYHGRLGRSGQAGGRALTVPGRRRLNGMAAVSALEQHYFNGRPASTAHDTVALTTAAGIGRRHRESQEGRRAARALGSLALHHNPLLVSGYF